MSPTTKQALEALETNPDPNASLQVEADGLLGHEELRVYCHFHGLEMKDTTQSNHFSVMKKKLPAHPAEPEKVISPAPTPSSPNSPSAPVASPAVPTNSAPAEHEPAKKAD